MKDIADDAKQVPSTSLTNNTGGYSFDAITAIGGSEDDDDLCKPSTKKQKIM